MTSNKPKMDKSPADHNIWLNSKESYPLAPRHAALTSRFDYENACIDFEKEKRAIIKEVNRRQQLRTDANYRLLAEIRAWLSLLAQYSSFFIALIALYFSLKSDV